jgi:hypothetical protein
MDGRKSSGRGDFPPEADQPLAENSRPWRRRHHALAIRAFADVAQVSGGTAILDDLFFSCRLGSSGKGFSVDSTARHSRTRESTLPGIMSVEPIGYLFAATCVESEGFETLEVVHVKHRRGGEI